MEEVGSLKCGCDVVMADGQTKVSGTSYSTYNIFYFLFNLKQFKPNLIRHSFGEAVHHNNIVSCVGCKELSIDNP